MSRAVISSSDTDGTIVSFDWDFGDGMTGSGSSVSHVYSGAGSYPVILTVHDELLTEVDEHRDDLNAMQFEQLMSIKSSTYDGLPLSVGAWEDKRYVK